jgi:hypothetical protein
MASEARIADRPARNLRDHPNCSGLASTCSMRLCFLLNGLPYEDQMRRWLFAILAISVFGVSAITQATEPVTPGPADSDLEWIYSCPSSKGCAFSCPTGAGGATAATGGSTTATGRVMATTGGTMAATHVTKLTIHLRRIRIDNEQAQAIFYDYSTMEVPSGSGFAINTGLGALSCQVNGMTLDYFGPPNSHGQKH